MCCALNYVYFWFCAFRIAGEFMKKSGSKEGKSKGSKSLGSSSANKEKKSEEKIVSLETLRKNKSLESKIENLNSDNSDSTAKQIIEKTKEKIMSKKNQAFDKASFEKFTKESADFGREYSEAMAKAGSIFMKGLEDMTGALVSMAQTSAEKQAKFAKEAMSIKTINEFAEVQNKIVQSNFDDFMAGFTKISEMGVKLLSEGTEPVNAQITKVIQRASESMAA